MFQEAIDDLRDYIKAYKISNVLVFDDVQRGKPGLVSVIKSPGCVIFPDFGAARSFNNDESEKSKVVPLIADCFVIVTGRKNVAVAVDLESLEDECMEKVWDLINLVTNHAFTIAQEGNTKTDYWMLNDIEWYDRSSSLCIIKVGFKLELQV